MSDSRSKFYLTTPIYYVNARPHIGHAYTTIVADVLARRHRLLGEDTFFLTGTDEHGQKIERSALAAGIPPQQFADQVSQSFKDLWKRMGITNDAFIRTTDDRHKQGVQHLFQTLKDRGYIYLSTYTGQYCVSDEAYVDGPPGIRCPDCGRVTETVSESNYYFRLSTFQLPLLNLIEPGPNGEPPQLLITPDSRRNEVLSFLRGNTNTSQPNAPSVAQRDMGEDVDSSPANDPATTHLEISPDPVILSEQSESKDLRFTAAGTPYLPGALKDLSISRTSFKWGIPVPGDEAHVIYVWLDALANYMTAIGYGSDDPAKQQQFEKYWPADLHLVGKEIIRFHCVYWPAFLLAAGLPTPPAITAHGWLLFDDSKMSKSKGNIVRTETILDAFGDHYRKELVRLGQPEPTKHEADLFASDVLRYFLLREIPFGQDGSFSFDALITRYNADLANGYGNLVSRTLKLIQQSLDSEIDCPTKPWLCEDRQSGWGDQAPKTIPEAFSGTAAIIRELEELPGRIAEWLGENRFQLCLAEIAVRVSIIDSYLSWNKPWLLAKATDDISRSKMIEVLYTAAESIRILTALLYPILPYATSKVWAQLGLGSIEAAAARGDLKDLTWGGLQPGTQLGPLSPIFPRAPKELAQTMADIESTPLRSTPKDLTTITDQVDATTSEQTEFPESSLASVVVPTPLSPEATDAPYPGETNPGRQAPAPSRLTNETTSAASPAPTSSFAPDAGPRTGTLPDPHPIAQVAGSVATTTERTLPPSHTEARPSSPFRTAASTQPITAHSSSLTADRSIPNPSTAHSSPLTADHSTPNPAPAAPSPEVPHTTNQITIDDFAKIELRVGRIIVCERIPKADKLLRLEVDLGTEQRQILSGIAEWYTPEELLGRKIVVITNLAPRKMRGLESHGMLLAASTGDNGKPALATFADSDNIEPGARLK